MKNSFGWTNFVTPVCRKVAPGIGDEHDFQLLKNSTSTGASAFGLTMCV
jgi:hypothetical protein